MLLNPEVQQPIYASSDPSWEYFNCLSHGDTALLLQEIWEKAQRPENFIQMQKGELHPETLICN